MRIEKGLLAAAALAAVLSAAPAKAAGPAVDFDQGVDVQSALRDARAGQAVPAAEVKPLMDRTERDCVTVSFSAKDPLTSERIDLVSREWREVCHNGPQGERWCRDELAWTERRSVRVQIIGRGEMLPWERDVFGVCLDGRWLQAWVEDASHKYDLSVPNWRGGLIEARAGAKTASLPDPAGVVAEAPRYDGQDRNFVLALKDRWASHYAGETLGLTVILKRDRPNWFDDTIVQRELTLPAAEAYAVRFADYARDFSQELKPGVSYYVKWRFRRLGKVSRDKWQRYWETGKTVFAAQTPALAAAAPATAPDPQAKGVNACWFWTVEGNQCVYRCGDGSFIRRPVREPDPFDRDGDTIACPQVVIPF